APMDDGQLAAALRPFGESRMLPPAAYTSAEVFAWERRHFFGGGWTCAGHSARLPAAGDQLAVETGAGGAVIVRGEDGIIRAFANTCRHRGHELLPCDSVANHGAANHGGANHGAANRSSTVHAKAIVCPYHSWVYSLSGELRGAPGYRDLAAKDWSLRELPAVEWHGLIFVDGSGGAAGPLPL